MGNKKVSPDLQSCDHSAQTHTLRAIAADTCLFLSRGIKRDRGGARNDEENRRKLKALEDPPPPPPLTLCDLECEECVNRIKDTVDTLSSRCKNKIKVYTKCFFRINKTIFCRYIYLYIKKYFYIN